MSELACHSPLRSPQLPHCQRLSEERGRLAGHLARAIRDKLEVTISLHSNEKIFNVLNLWKTTAFGRSHSKTACQRVTHRGCA